MTSPAITELLLQIQDGDRQAYEVLLPMVYDELRRIAERAMRHERAGHTLQPTALVHEAYLRLVDQRAIGGDSRRQFYAIAATVMRRILVDSARQHRAEKRGGGDVVQLQPHMDVGIDADRDVMDVDRALEQLARLDARQAQIVELRYFVGLSVEETAAVLGISDRTVKRDWAVARAFLHRALDDV